MLPSGACSSGLATGKTVPGVAISLAGPALARAIRSCSEEMAGGSVGVSGRYAVLAHVVFRAISAEDAASSFGTV